MHSCVICLCDYEENDNIRVLKCKHYFHASCCDEWLGINKICPLCQQDIEVANNVHNFQATTEINFNDTEIQPLATATSSKEPTDEFDQNSNRTRTPVKITIISKAPEASTEMPLP